MTSLYSISQQIEKMLEGANPATASKFEMQEIKRVVIQVINGMIKAQHVTEEMAGGESIPDGSVLTEYDNVPVVSYKNTARAVLPAMPVKLLKNMGVWHVSRTDDIINGFIPFEPGQLQMLGEEPLISDILGQIGYEPMGKYIVFNKDITVNDDDNAITEVYMKLIVKDLSLYGDFEMLPIPASSEIDVIMSTFQVLTGQLPGNKKVDVVSKQQEAVK